MSDRILLFSLFLNTLAIDTLGRVPGWLKTVALVPAFLLSFATLLSIFQFIRLLRRENGNPLTFAFLLALITQCFWAFFRAPLDVDGLFYHLPLVLESLQKNGWGVWDFPLWQIRNTPHFGEMPHLSFILIGREFGYRFSQFGQFPAIFLGVWACVRIARELRLARPSLLGLLFFLTPLVTKQLSSHYVDVSAHAYFLSALALILEMKSYFNASLIFFGMSLFLHAGIKMSGPVTSLALLPLLLFRFQKKPLLPLFVFASSIALSLCDWALPNLLRYADPLFPLNTGRIFGENTLPLFPKQLGITSDFHPLTFLSGDYPFPLRWFFQFFTFEPVATYDQGSGAWGFTPIWGAAVFLFYFKKRKKLNQTEIFFFTSLILLFFLMPGRWVPRHGLLIGMTFLFYIFVTFEKVLGQFFKSALTVCLIANALYTAVDRSVLRGTSRLGFSESLETMNENLNDIVAKGEPQTPSRFFHHADLQRIRRDEPRSVEIKPHDPDLYAVFWGRKFTNQVSVSPKLARWPYSSE